MKKTLFTLERVRRLAGDIWELRLSGDTSAITVPGQFVNIELPGKFLRRPISVCDWGPGSLTLLVKEAGEGTKELVRLPAGTELDVLSGLGNGFDLTRVPENAVNTFLVGGGIGAAPLYLGTKGFVTDVLKTLPGCAYLLACGPTPMLKAVHALPRLTGGQFSFEARMACGFGACVGCTIQTEKGLRRVCKDGPIFHKEDILW